MNPTTATYLRAVSLGAVTGIRSLAGLAMLSYSAASGRIPGYKHTPFAWLASDDVAKGLVVAEVAETIGDKLPWVPSRTSPAGLLPRVATGAFLGVAGTATKQRNVVGVAAAGALAAALTSWLFTWLRGVESHKLHIPNVVGGLVEDGLVGAVAYHVIRSPSHEG